METQSVNCDAHLLCDFEDVQRVFRLCAKFARQVNRRIRCNKRQPQHHRHVMPIGGNFPELIKVVDHKGADTLAGGGIEIHFGLDRMGVNHP